MAAGEDIAADLGDSARDTIFRTAFTGVNFKAQFAHSVGERRGVERLTRFALINLRHRRAIDRGVRPDRELRVAMFAQNKSVDALRTDRQRFRQRAAQAGGVEPDAGADHLIARQAGEFPYLPGDDIARVSRHEENAVKAARHHLRNNLADDARGIGQLVKPRLARFQRAAGDSYHRDIDIRALLCLAGGDGNHPRHIRGGVAQILTMSFNARGVEIHQNQLLADILVQQGPGGGGADVARADNHHFSCSVIHGVIPC